MSAVIRGSGVGLGAGAAVPVVLGLAEQAHVGALEEDAPAGRAPGDLDVTRAGARRIAPPHFGHVISSMPPTLLLPDQDILRSVSTPRTGFAFLDEPVEKGAGLAFAHRGGALHPDLVGLENTLEAFRSAADLGYRYLETDVQTTRDGVLMVFHDDVLDRVDRPRRPDPVAHPRRPRRACRVGGRAVVPTLESVARGASRTPASTSTSSPGRASSRWSTWSSGCGCTTASASAPSRSGCCGASAARPAAGSRPAAGCSRSARCASRRSPDASRPLLRDSGRALQVPHVHRGITYVDRRFVERAHASGRQVHVWTIDDRAEMEYLLDLGVDGIISDRTDVLREVLVERGPVGGTVMSAGTTPGIADLSPLARRREQKAWYWYDWANSAYFTTILTVLFAPYMIAVVRGARLRPCSGDGLRREGGRARRGHRGRQPRGLPRHRLDPDRRRRAARWSGAVIDRSVTQAGPHGGLRLGRRRLRRLAVLRDRRPAGRSAPSRIVASNILVGCSLVVYDAILNDIATEDERDRVSSRGWALGYLGGGLLLAGQPRRWCSGTTRSA